MVDPAYCVSRFRSVRRVTREVRVGQVGVGGANPIRLQSMTTSDTEDVVATLAQCIQLAEVGCEIIRITAPNKAAAHALKTIHQQFRAAGFTQPLVADIHFLPVAAMEAVEHVEKVRVNPGNYADKKKFAIREYTDAQYGEELERLHEAFSPLVLRAKVLGRALRIGSNHGSLSDRIMNRFGDSPLGMVESALEFVRICESHGLRDLVLSMKSSNPKVMVEAYRLAARRMREEGMDYPLHLGVTEAGEGEDARIKSAIGIGALLADGLGDTIRVSLTEDPWHEIPVCRQLVKAVEAFQPAAIESRLVPQVVDEAACGGVDPYVFNRRATEVIVLSKSCRAGSSDVPRVVVRSSFSLSQSALAAKEVIDAHARQREARVEGLLVRYESNADATGLAALRQGLESVVPAIFVEVDVTLPAEFPFKGLGANLVVVRTHNRFSRREDTRAWAEACAAAGVTLAINTEAEYLSDIVDALTALPVGQRIVCATHNGVFAHALGEYRRMVSELARLGLAGIPLWIRTTAQQHKGTGPAYPDQLLHASVLAGGLLVDGLGDLVSCEVPTSFDKRLTLAYDILQGARARQTKTEYIACPSCGRTLFDIQSTTLKVKARTDHLKGVTIAVMGCIVNGPGEMADADFGYVGGAPGKINLYVGKTPVKFNIPQEEAVDRLVDLIKEKGKWVTP
jgi:(E)-4-hydroxy-3-methylbut-2-enyl-diphosphate synthase